MHGGRALRARPRVSRGQPSRETSAAAARYAERMKRAFGVLAFVVTAGCEAEPSSPSLTPIEEPARELAATVAELRVVDAEDQAWVRAGFPYYTKRDVAGQRVWCRRSTTGGPEQELLHERELHG